MVGSRDWRDSSCASDKLGNCCLNHPLLGGGADFSKLRICSCNEGMGAAPPTARSTSVGGKVKVSGSVPGGTVTGGFGGTGSLARAILRSCSSVIVE